MAFNGEAVRDLAAQFLALAEKQGATVPLMIGHRIMGSALIVNGRLRRRRERISIAQSRFTILTSIVRWRRDLAEDIRGGQFRSFGRWPCGVLAYPEAALAELNHAVKSGARDWPSLQL